MRYEEALAEWGARRIEADNGWGRHTAPKVDRSSVKVEFSFHEGYACCGGTDPSCYCSFAESPRAEVVIRGRDVTGGTLGTTIDADGFDFATVLAEIVSAGGGNVNGDTAA